MTASLTSFPISSRDANSMATLGYTGSQTLLYDYGETEDFYVLVKSMVVGGDYNPDFGSDFAIKHVAVGNLYNVGAAYASKWFGLNGSNGLVIVFNPFFRAVQ